MFPEPTKLRLIGYSIESMWTRKPKSNMLTPRTNSQMYWQREISHVMNGIIFLCLFNIRHFSSINNLEAMSKRTPEVAGEERVTAKSKPMMNLVSRYSARDPNVLASTASESLGKTIYESQNVPLSSLNVQQTNMERPVLGASSSNYSEWNIDDKWSSQVWKSCEMSGAGTGRPVDDKFVIDYDMDSDTAKESNLSLKSRSLLNTVNDRLRKTLDHSSKDAMQDIDKRSMIWWMFMSSTLEASVFMGKITQTTCIPSKNIGKDLALKQMFEMSEKLIVGQSDENFWSDSNQLGRLSMETVISGQRWRSHQFLACKGSCILRFRVMSWKDESEPHIKYCLGTPVGLVQRFITIQNFWHSWRRTDGIRVTYFPGFTTLQLCNKVQEFMSKMCDPSEFKERIIFMSMFDGAL